YLRQRVVSGRVLRHHNRAVFVEFGVGERWRGPETVELAQVEPTFFDQPPVYETVEPLLVSEQLQGSFAVRHRRGSLRAPLPVLLCRLRRFGLRSCRPQVVGPCAFGPPRIAETDSLLCPLRPVIESYERRKGRPYCLVLGHG